MFITVEYQIANIEAEIGRIMAEQDQTRPEIKQLIAILQSALSNLYKLLTFDAELSHAIKLRQIVTKKLKLEGGMLQ